VWYGDDMAFSPHMRALHYASPNADPLLGRDVDVYFNLHRKVWSVRDRKTRRVIAHVDKIMLANVTFKVSAAGNARVRAEGRKNVHAFARGRVVDLAGGKVFNGVPITYNPYKHTTFVTKDFESPVAGAWWAMLDGRSVEARGVIFLDMVAQSGKVAS
jgi:hypothetical protein